MSYVREREGETIRGYFFEGQVRVLHRRATYTFEKKYVGDPPKQLSPMHCDESLWWDIFTTRNYLRKDSHSRAEELWSAILLKFLFYPHVVNSHSRIHKRGSSPSRPMTNGFLLHLLHISKNPTVLLSYNSKLRGQQRLELIFHREFFLYFWTLVEATFQSNY